MAAAITEDMSASLQKGLSDWWTEETEYVFQRIERWAAFARGYNRLRSQRLSRGRLTMQEEQEPRWTISSNKIIIEDPAWSPRFHNLKRSHRRKSRTDENCKINCCGGFNYQSNGNLDSTCLETYRYDHSIYFKTIGDIKSSKKDLRDSRSEIDRASCCSDEQIEWEAKTAPDCLENRDFVEDETIDVLFNDNVNARLQVPGVEINIRDFDEPENRQIDKPIRRDSWSIVDLTKLSLDIETNNQVSTDDAQDLDKDTRENCIADEINSDDDDDNNNNNCFDESVDSTQKMIQLQIAELTNNQTRLMDNASTNSRATQNNREGTAKFLNLRKQRRSPRRVRQPTVVGDNNVLWPGVLLNYTKNIDPETSPHHHRAVHVK